jgi:hypothetical protein
MGKLTSVPKAPPRPTYVYIPAPAPLPAPTPAPSPSDAGSGASSGTSAPPPAPDEAAQRVAGFLASRRGRIGTILTGFRGFLEPSAAVPVRKTLLGE